MENKNKTAQEIIDESVDNETDYKRLFYPTIFYNKE